MRRFATWTLLLVMAVVSAPTALAAEPKKSPEERFAKLDKDGDKKLSEEEFIGKKKDQAKTKATKRFAKLDKDSDNFLTFEEFNVMKKKKAS